MINPPWFQNPIEQTAFNAYAQHQQSVEDFTKMLAASPNPNDLQTQLFLLDQAGLQPDDLTDADIQYIEREATKRNAL